MRKTPQGWSPTLPDQNEARRVTVHLNQQQLELIDRTLGKGIATSREDLLRLALREYSQARQEAS